MKAIVVGGGKIGFYLANALPEHGYSVTMIEADREQCRYCANNLEAEVFCGDGTSGKVLRESGAEHADVVIAVMGQDEKNLVCCQMAKKLFGVKKAIAKVNNPKNADGLKKLGVDIVISATDNIIRALEREVDLSSVKELIPLDGEASLLEITLPDDYPLEGITLQELKLPTTCNVACINRSGRTIIPRGGTVLSGGDIILVVATGHDEKGLRKALNIKG